MLHDRIDMINRITRTLSIMMCDVKLHQSMNDFSVNIHAEDFFKGVINRLYNANFINDNGPSKNTAYIDLVDHSVKRFIQVTSTVKKQKIDNSLKVLLQPQYKNYSVEILYLVEKPLKFKKESIAEFEKVYGITDIHSHLKDSSDLLNDIKNLNDSELFELYKNHFASVEEKYTDEIALQLIFELLLKSRKTKKINYDDDFGSINTPDKIDVNKLNNRLATHINLGLDYTQTIYNLDDQNQIDDIRRLVVDDFYAEILRENLRRFKAPLELQKFQVLELHKLAKENGICFNKVLYSLVAAIESKIIKVDFNAQSVCWIIVSYFFEICDVGLKE